MQPLSGMIYVLGSLCCNNPTLLYNTIQKNAIAFHGLKKKPKDFRRDEIHPNFIPVVYNTK